jgi:hypothetical protein
MSRADSVYLWLSIVVAGPHRRKSIRDTCGGRFGIGRGERPIICSRTEKVADYENHFLHGIDNRMPENQVSVHKHRNIIQQGAWGPAVTRPTSLLMFEQYAKAVCSN